MPPKRMLFPCEQSPDLAPRVLGWTAVFPSFTSCIWLGSSHPLPVSLAPREPPLRLPTANVRFCGK